MNEKLCTRKFDGSKDYRTIIEKKEEVFLSIGLIFSTINEKKYQGTGSLVQMSVSS